MPEFHNPSVLPGGPLVVVCAALPVAFSIFGLQGAIVVVTSGGVAEYVIENYGMWRHGMFLPRQDIQTTFFWLTTTLLTLVLRNALGLDHPAAI